MRWWTNLDPARRRAVVIAATAAVVAAMASSTTYVSTSAVAAGQPASFDPGTFAAERLPQLTKGLTDKAVPITELAKAVDQDPNAAGRRYGQDLGAGSFAVPVSASGSVSSADGNFALLDVRGLPLGDVVRIPLAAAVNGAPVRDATGLIHYGDFNDQTAYQDVATALRTLLLKKVIEPAALANQVGKKVDVVGAFATGGPKKSYIIQPVSITVAGS